MNRQERLVKAMAPCGGLFLLITLPELRRQGLTYLALYALTRTVEEARPLRNEGFPVAELRRETGLSDFEISRACSLLKKAGLVQILKVAGDGRERLLMPTARGERILAKIYSVSGRALWDRLAEEARGRRISETTQFLTRANDKLLGPYFQLTIFDKGLSWKLPKSDH